MQSSIRPTTYGGGYHRPMLTPTTSDQTRGSRLRELRAARKMSQGDVASAIGIKTQGTISDWENDKREPEPENLLKLAELFRVPAESLGFPMPRNFTDEPPLWARDMGAKLDALIAYHRSGGNIDHLEGL